MDTLYETVVNFFQEDGWPVHLLDEDAGLQTAFRGETGQWVCQALVSERLEQMRFYSLAPIRVPDTKMTAAAEFLTRANFGLTIGNFELDFDDGEVRYKTSLDVEGDRLTHALCRQIVVANVVMMDRYLPGLMAVISGAQSPAQAIANIEGH
ncbi:MAG: YbjN domain-containing protein [Myxococcota bacterium]|nr:YbjN domain-containing protein [Myxococcota bacterium]